MNLREVWLKMYEKDRECLEDCDALRRYIKFNGITNQDLKIKLINSLLHYFDANN